MKIKPEHYKQLRDAIATVPLEQIVEHRKKLKDDFRVNDLEKRMRWDLLNAVMPAAWVCDNVYPYANDTHLDTALRSIMKELSL